MPILPTKYSEAWLDQMTHLVATLKEIQGELTRAKLFEPDWNWSWDTPTIARRRATVKMSTAKLIRILEADVDEAQKAIDKLTSMQEAPKPRYRGSVRARCADALENVEGGGC